MEDSSLEILPIIIIALIFFINAFFSKKKKGAQKQGKTDQRADNIVYQKILENMFNIKLGEEEKPSSSLAVKEKLEEKKVPVPQATLLAKKKEEPIVKEKKKTAKDEQEIIPSFSRNEIVKGFIYSEIFNEPKAFRR